VFALFAHRLNPSTGRSRRNEVVQTPRNQVAVTVIGQLSIAARAAFVGGAPIKSQIILAPRRPSYSVPSRQIA
jgi:hypothetical protein